MENKHFEVTLRFYLDAADQDAIFEAIARDEMAVSDAAVAVVEIDNEEWQLLSGGGPAWQVLGV